MREDEARSITIFFGILLAYTFYRAGVADLSPVDIGGIYIVTFGFLYFVYLFVKRRFA